MDYRQYSTLLDVLQRVPDPRCARGKQLEWTFILGVIAKALLSQQRAISAIAQWTQHHAATLVATFHPARGRVPSEATLRRALRHVDNLPCKAMRWMGNMSEVRKPMMRQPYS